MEWITIHAVLLLVIVLIKWCARPDKIDLEVAEEQALKESFDELVKDLITLSLPADDQKELVGSVHVSFEMVDEFEANYVFNKEKYIEASFINQSQKLVIDKLELFLQEVPRDFADDFWNDDLLDSNADWEKIRVMAGNILKIIGKDDLIIAYERTQKGDVVFTKRELISKLATENYPGNDYLT